MKKPQEDKLKNILIRKGIGGLTLIDFLGIKESKRTKEVLTGLAKEGDRKHPPSYLFRFNR